MRFQDLFHSPPGVLFAFPSRYWFTIGRLRVFSLGGWSPIFRQDFSCPALLVSTLVPHVCFRIQGYHLLWPDFPFRFANSRAINRRLFRFRSPLLSESRLMSFPRATEMFQFTRFASHDYVFIMRYLCRWVSPFGNLRIKANLPAPRSLSQAITSFVAYHCQGIHHVLLFT